MAPMTAPELAEILAGAIETACAPLHRRIQALEAQGTIVFAGTYDPAKSYKRGSVVVRRGSSWVCLKDGNTDDPGRSPQPNPPTWALMAQRGADGKDLR